MSGRTTVRSRVVTFLYHEVTDDPTSTGFQRASALPYKHGVREFTENLEAIAASGMTPALCHPERREGSALAFDASSDKPQLMLTFDDGGKSALHISRELDRRGWKGHFFVTTAWIDDPRFLSRDDIRDIHARGHVIGAHSHTHPVPFYSQNRDRLLGEWKMSTQILSDIVGQPIVAASVPGGDLDEVVQETAAEAGVEYLFTSEPTFTPWRAGGVTNFGRVYPLRGTSLDRVADYARFRGFRRDMAIRRAKGLVRTALGPMYRMLVARSFKPAS